MIYSSSVYLSGPLKMPLVRRRRPMKLSSSPETTTVDAQGTAFLCFPEDHSWFQGSISTDDESNYSLYGQRVTISPEEKAAAAVAVAAKVARLSQLTESDEENNNAGDDDDNNGNEPNANNGAEAPATEDYYRVTMIDHFSGDKHVLPRIFVRQPEDSIPSTVATPGHLFTSEQGEVTFQVENVYKGQKAEMMIQRYVGSPSHLGSKCLLYSGQINILFNDTVEAGRSWSL